jgi:hypothetical protein
MNILNLIYLGSSIATFVALLFTILQIRKTKKASIAEQESSESTKKIIKKNILYT